MRKTERTVVSSYALTKEGPQRVVRGHLSQEGQKGLTGGDKTEPHSFSFYFIAFPYNFRT